MPVVVLKHSTERLVVKASQKQIPETVIRPFVLPVK
jgi:hypothetical protein